VCSYQKPRQTQAAGISTVRDRVCMTAAMLSGADLSKPISTGNLRLPRWAHAQQAAVEVEGLLSAAIRRLDATLRTTSEHSTRRPPKVGGAPYL